MTPKSKSTRTMPKIARGLADIPAKTIYVLLKLAEEGDVVSLGVGEPDLDAPPAAINAATKALQSGRTHYSPDPGLFELREAVRKKTVRDNRFDFDPERQIIITPGASAALFGVLLATVEEGDEVIIPSPGYLAYEPVVQFTGATPIMVPSDESNGFIPQADTLKDAVNENTRGLIICTPNNPTGMMWDRESLELVRDLAVDNDFYVYSDELYSNIVFDDNEHVSIASLDGMDKLAVTISGMSKNYSMTGFRIGWVIGSESVISAYRKIHQYTAIAASTPSQIASIAALEDSGGYVDEMVTEYERRRRLLLQRFANDIPLMRAVKPDGSFYMMVSVAELVEKHMDDMTAFLKSEENRCLYDKFPQAARDWVHEGRSGSKITVLYLLCKAGVLTGPGIAFGESAENYLRISFGQSYPLIEEALDRMGQTLSEWR
ncbi:MAG: aminotransferase class I/II-fold pyridoxal phosphate-dependent enzyme [Candidatus Thorarchaeota archaeon]